MHADTEIARWLARLRDVVSFLNEHGRLPKEHCVVGPEERSLAQWRYVNHYRLQQGLLDQQRADLFVNAGLAVNRPEAMWRAKLDRTVAFVKRHKRLPSSRGSTQEERVVGRWRCEQHAFLKSGALSELRKKLFIDAGLGRTILERKWHRTLKQVIQFRKKHGHIPRMSHVDPNEAHLGAWCSNNRQFLAEGRLDRKRKAIIIAAGLNDKAQFRDKWRINYQRLLRFCQFHERLPANNSTGREHAVYRWYISQLSFVRRERLDQGRANLIVSLQEAYRPAEEPRVAVWKSRYRSVRSFVDKNGRLPRFSLGQRPSEDKLASWLRFQRLRFRRKNMTAQEMVLLSNLDASMSDIAKWSNLRPRRRQVIGTVAKKSLKAGAVRPAKHPRFRRAAMNSAGSKNHLGALPVSRVSSAAGKPD